MTLVKSLHKVIVCSSIEQFCGSATIARKKGKNDLIYALKSSLAVKGTLGAWASFLMEFFSSSKTVRFFSSVDY